MGRKLVKRVQYFVLWNNPPTKTFHIAAFSTPAIIEILRLIILKKAFPSHFFEAFSRKCWHVHGNNFECPYYENAKVEGGKSQKL